MGIEDEYEGVAPIQADKKARSPMGFLRAEPLECVLVLLLVLAPMMMWTGIMKAWWIECEYRPAG